MDLIEKPIVARETFKGIDIISYHAKMGPINGPGVPDRRQTSAKAGVFRFLQGSILVQYHRNWGPPAAFL
jgi:hypothetical protein